MNASDQKEVLSLVREHFGGATDGDGPLVWNAVKGYDLADVRHALVQHRTELGSKAYRPDINRVKGIAHGRWRERYRGEQKDLRIVDCIRRENPAAYPPDMGDIPAVLAHFAVCWDHVQTNADEGIGLTAARVYILAHCRRALTELGVSPEESDAEARMIVGLQPGERVMRVRLFKEMPEPQTAWDATKAIAKAEAEQPAAAVS